MEFSTYPNVCVHGEEGGQALGGSAFRLHLRTSGNAWEVKAARVAFKACPNDFTINEEANEELIFTATPLRGDNDND